MKLLLNINPENASEAEAAAYEKRQASRAVVFDADGNVALLHVSKKHFYKLPGGGLEGDENPLDALVRECKEEIGCEVAEARELGVITEYRKMFGVHQTSYCFTAKVIGDKCDPDFTEREKNDGFSIEWMSLDSAIEKVSNATTDTPEATRYIIPRDICILTTAKAALGL